MLYGIETIQLILLIIYNHLHVNSIQLFVFNIYNKSWFIEAMVVQAIWF